MLFEESEPERSRGVSTQESSMERSTEASDGGSGGTGPPRKKSMLRRMNSSWQLKGKRNAL